ncbi:AraC family transcriptional regulator [Novimethylophilus kurashikiensis]|uniref:AraC family transcriptional regulator n=1 Tax=Novimethylophilus kurashikiensis TaxID=1825523 RepID=A0A2R5F902_9PROT|nr:AraC family transcriptional regulator [Novimethylophilus kurashikiensis]GBG13104.1 AraC family transcriptional regulator [Novimethylophilus kurashikiensis]
MTQFTVQPGWRLLICDIGVNPDDVLRLAGLPSDLFSRKDATVSTAQYFQLWHALEQVDGTQMLPLKIGKAISVEAFDPAIFASLCSPNLNIALQRLSSFKKLIGPMTLIVDVGAERTSITLECYGDDGLMPRNLAVTELVFITQLVRLGTRYRMIPKEIVLPELPDQLEAYVDYFGVAPKRGKLTRVSFSKQDGVRPFLTANESMWEFFEGSLRKRLSTLDSTARMSDRVKAVLLEGLPAGQYSIDFVAKQLAVSTRTLQRQLSEESTSFTDVLNATRQQLAMHYLRKPAMAQGEIAYLLGFQDVNSFNRAFKDWTGTTPGSYRHKTEMQLVS